GVHGPERSRRRAARPPVDGGRRRHRADPGDGPAAGRHPGAGRPAGRHRRPVGHGRRGHCGLGGRAGRHPDARPGPGGRRRPGTARALHGTPGRGAGGGRRRVDRPDQPAPARVPEGPGGGRRRRVRHVAQHVAGARRRRRPARPCRAAALRPRAPFLVRLRPEL
ncbi:MAG: hypothetical protein AVDCRST_MAG48-963, partial [uncultured Friedmanniella sp.]